MNAAVLLPELAEVDFAPIAEVAVVRIRRPLRAPFRTALREVRELEAWRLDVTTTDGATGHGTTVATPQISGDTDAAVHRALATEIRAAVLGRSGLRAALDAVAACSAGPAARAAADLAVHDLGGTVSGVGLHALLTGRTDARDSVPTDVTISVDSPQTMAEQAVARLRDGFSVLKAKLADHATDLARVRAVWEVVRDAGATLRVDPNQSWSPEDAVRLLDSLAADGVELELVEQPVAAADLDGMSYVTARSPFPVLADESVFTGNDARRVADRAAAHLVNVKLLKTGGLGPARDVVAACVEAGLGLLVGCMLEPAEGVGVARTLAGAATDGDLAHDLDAGWWAETGAGA